MNLKLRMSRRSLPSKHSSSSSLISLTLLASFHLLLQWLSASPLHLIQTFPLVLIHISLICEEHGERKSLSNQSCTYFTMVLFEESSCAYFLLNVLLMLICINHWRPGFCCQDHIGHQLWRKPCGRVYLQVSCCLVIAANSVWRDIHIRAMALVCLSNVRNVRSRSRGGLQKWSEWWNTSPTRTGCKGQGCSAWRREGSREALLWPFSK